MDRRSTPTPAGSRACRRPGFPSLSSARLLALAIACLLLVGCAPRIALDIAAAPEINPDPDGQPLPVLVSAYQLDDPETLEGVERAALVRDERAALGGWVAREELMLEPGERRVLELSMEDEADYLALAAHFREAEQEAWRAVVPLPAQLWGVRPGREVVVALKGQAVYVGEEAERRRLAADSGEVAP